MKRYLVFAGRAFYPSGGWQDFQCGASDLETAKALGQCAIVDFERDGWWQVVDTHALQIVAEHG